MADNVLNGSESNRSGESGTGDVAVRIDNLTKRYGDLVAVDGVAFDILEGEFFTILGPSGSGKSTLLRMLAGLEDATEGTVMINGRDMAGVPPEKRPTNMIFQHLALFPHKNVYENLEFGLKMQGVGSGKRRERADEMLEILGLEYFGDNAIEELSGGEQQRIALGRSLLTDPEILLLDEPLSSLDRKLKEEMQLELRRIHDEIESTFLYVTHDQDVALTASDRVAVINNGELIQVGTPQELYETPVSRFVAEFIGDTNFFVCEVTSSDGNRHTMETADGLRMTVVADGEFHTGDRGQLSLRPEELSMGEDTEGLGNVYNGLVEERVYRGDRTRYVVAVDEIELLVQRSRQKEEREFDIGDAVRVGWNEGAGYLIGEA